MYSNFLGALSRRTGNWLQPIGINSQLRRNMLIDVGKEKSSDWVKMVVLAMLVPNVGPAAALLQRYHQHAAAIQHLVGQALIGIRVQRIKSSVSRIGRKRCAEYSLRGSDSGLNGGNVEHREGIVGDAVFPSSPWPTNDSHGNRYWRDGGRGQIQST